MLRVEWRNCAKHLDCLIANGITMQASRSLHGQKSHHLKHVVLDHVPDRSSGIVKFPSPFNAELFRHGDLDTLNVIPVPDRLQEAVGDAKEKKIEDGFFAKVMVIRKMRDSGSTACRA